MTTEEMVSAIKDALRQTCTVPWAEWCSEPTHRGLREVIKALTLDCDTRRIEP